MILLVEDDESNLIVLTELLDALGFDYRAASTLQEGLKLLRTFTPDILLTDLCLNAGMNAYPLIKECKLVYPKCRIVLLTATTKPVAEQAAKELPVDRLLMKPFDIEDLEKVLHDKNYTIQ